MASCLLGLGSNLGDRGRSLEKTLARLHRHTDIELLRQSRIRETVPVGGPAGQSAYLNAAALVRTSLEPRALLQACQEIENELGRRRDVRWGPRTIDLDLLLYDDRVLNEPDLQIPHPRMAWRRFVLEPAAEIAAAMVHPEIGWNVLGLLDHLNDTPWYLAIDGPISGRKSLAAVVARRVGAWLLSDEFAPARQRASGGDSSSHARQMALQSLEARARLLDRDQPCWTNEDRPTISDFWFDDLPANQDAEHTAAWSKLRRRVMRPRLVALIRGQRDETSVQERGQGPLLWLDVANEEASLVELTAAVEAMR